jgi:hypothetical protein
MPTWLRASPTPEGETTITVRGQSFRLRKKRKAGVSHDLTSDQEEADD